MQSGQFVEHVGEPLTLLLPVEVHAPKGVVERFCTHRHLRGQSLFGEVLHGTAHLEILREVVLPVQAEHRLPHLPVVGEALQRHVHRRSGIDDALVQNGHLAGIVIHRIVGAFVQFLTAGCHHHRPWRHVVGTQRNHAGIRTAKLSHEQVFVFLGHLLGGSLRGVVEFGEGILLSHGRRDAITLQIVLKVLAERLHAGEEHAPVAHRVAAHVVEIAIRMGLVVVIQAVGTDQLDDGQVFHLRLRNIREVHARGIALVFHVEPELVALHRRCQVIHVAHHQLPVRHLRRLARVLERFHVKGVGGIAGDVRGKFSHLVGLAVVRIFIGHGQHLVGL